MKTAMLIVAVAVAALANEGKPVSVEEFTKDIARQEITRLVKELAKADMAGNERKHRYIMHQIRVQQSILKLSQE